MTPNKRIFLNIVATYGRSLFALVCGLFTSRWVLEALGEVDYGLYGVVGGIAVFITLLNGILAVATGRYYAFAFGSAQKTDFATGLEECRKWFSTSVLIHSAVPCFLLIVGYPIGVHAVEHWLTIPAERLDDCVWVLRFVCVTAFVSMINAPFNAMYTAKQYIAELTVYSFVQTLLNACFVFYMFTHPGDWLRRYALWSMVLAVAPQVLICFRAMRVFPECKFRLAYAWNPGRMKHLGKFAFWQTIGGFGAIMRGQGIQILINKYFGPATNAAMTIAHSVSGHTQTLSAAMQGAFSPAIITACGAGDFSMMRKLAFRTCKFGMLLGLIFMLPLALELEGVLKLWLKNPPRHAEELCFCVLLAAIIDKSTTGHMLAVNANGKIAAYHAFLGGALISTLPVAWTFVAMGWGVASVGWAIVLGTAMCAWGRVWFARSLVGMGGWHWVKKIMLPCAIATAAAGGAGWLTSMAMEAGIWRIVCVAGVADMVLAGLAWRTCLDGDEREFVISKIRDRLGRRGR